MYHYYIKNVQLNLDELNSQNIINSSSLYYQYKKKQCEELRGRTQEKTDFILKV